MELKPQNIIDTLNSIELMTNKLNIELSNKKEALRNLDIFKEIHDIEIRIKELEKQDEQIREQ